MDGSVDARPGEVEYTTEEIVAAAGPDLESSLSAFARAGVLNRTTPEFERVRAIFRRLTDIAKQRSALAQKLDWAIYVHEGRLAEAYSRAGGQIVISAPFLQRYRLNDAELAFVIGHEIAHVLCEHERMNLSAVRRINPAQQLAASYAMEFLDAEPTVRARLAPVVLLQERIADRLGLEFAAASGIDPVSALGFFDKNAGEIQDGSLFPDRHEAPAKRKSSLLALAPPSPPLAGLFRPNEPNCAP